MRKLPGLAAASFLFSANLVPLLPATDAAQLFADPSFRTTWERTDKPLADGTVKRSFYWGPAPLQSHIEPYAEGPGGKRTVQYFDKSRMEINNPSGNRNDPFFVTNGLLTTELMLGRIQVGNNSYVERYRAHIPLASDSDDAQAPTYASFARLMATRAENRTGQRVVNYLERDGSTRTETPAGSGPEIIALYEPATGHNIPTVFKQFLDLQGPVWVGGKLQTARLSDPWFYTTGYPITEAYWAKVKIAGKRDTDVLIQAYQRRVLTYVPSLPAEFQVQMGNIGLHYYDWRYRDAGRPPGSVTPTPGGKPAGTVSVSGEVKSPMTFDVAALRTFTPTTVTATFTEADGSRRTARYTGPLLLDVLKRAGGQEDGGRELLGRYMVATGEGGRKVTVSWGEIDPIFSGTQAIVALSRDGTDLAGAEGPARLVMPKDKSGLRSLYGLSSIEVRTVPYVQPSGNTLVIGGEVTRTLQLTGNDLPSRNPTSVTVSYMAGGVTSTHTYRGVPLFQLLNEAGVKSGGTDRTRDLLRKIVVGQGRDDGRLAVFSWGEIDPQYAGVNVLVAYEEDGIRLGGNLTRLVVPTDARGGRYTPYLLAVNVADGAR
jgi:DMSO/TMAO reductase YedYZ molybdopterin-dependent catalytic subunit